MPQQTQKIAVVTGGSAGVGRATVQELSRRGYDVAVIARGAAGLAGAVRDVEANGRRGLAVPCDVADHVAVDAAAERVERDLGPIDLWVNVAFCGALAYFWDLDPEEYTRITTVTYQGQVNGTRAALARMRPRDHGVIVNVGSAMSYRSIPLQSAYCGAKHAVKGFTESVLTELKHEKSKVKICMVQLPGLNTPQFNWNLNRTPGHPKPVPPFLQPELPARAIAFLAEHPRRNMWVGIATAYTIIGEKLAPFLADLYLARTGVSSQQTDADLPRLGSNLSEPRDVEIDAGAHGPFDAQAHRHDPVLWLSTHRRLLALTLARGAAGSGLLADPEGLLRGLGGSRARVDSDARRYARLLGVRHLLEAAVLWADPTRRTAEAGSVVDALHAVSTLWLIRRPDRRRLGLINGAAAALFAAAGQLVAAEAAVPRRRSLGRIARR